MGISTDRRCVSILKVSSHREERTAGVFVNGLLSFRFSFSVSPTIRWQRQGYFLNEETRVINEKHHRWSGVQRALVRQTARKKRDLRGSPVSISSTCRFNEQFHIPFFLVIFVSFLCSLNDNDRSRAVISQQSRESSPASVRLSFCLAELLSFMAIFVTYLFFSLSFIVCIVLGRGIVAGGTSRDKPRPTCRRPFRLLQHNTDTAISFEPVSTMLWRKQKAAPIRRFFFRSFFLYFARLAALTPSRFSKFRKVRTPKSKTISRK